MPHRRGPGNRGLDAVQAPGCDARHQDAVQEPGCDARQEETFQFSNPMGRETRKRQDADDDAFRSSYLCGTQTGFLAFDR